MDTGVVIFLILGGASIISSVCFGLIPGIRQKKIEKLFNFSKSAALFFSHNKFYINQLQRFFRSKVVLNLK